MKADTENRDGVELAREALGLPSPLEVKFDPAYAWELLGQLGPPEIESEINAQIEGKARGVIASLQKKLESGSNSGPLTLGYKLVKSIFRECFENGGVLEIGETSKMRSGQCSILHDIIDYSRRASISTADGEVFRHPFFFVFFTNNLEYEEDKPLPPPMVSRMALDMYWPEITEGVATSRLVKALGCEPKRDKARAIVKAYLALSKEARNLSLPGGLDFRNLKQIANRILNHDFDPRLVFEMEVLHHFSQYSDPESRISDEAALLGILDELDLFRG